MCNALLVSLGPLLGLSWACPSPTPSSMLQLGIVRRGGKRMRTWVPALALDPLPTAVCGRNRHLV